jgi:tetratricopeptide (TPR) repeat protein
LRDNPSSCLFDEHDYFLGEIALLAAGAERLLGNRAGVELWLERAEAAFRHTVNPGPSLAQVSYVRLTLRYDKGAYDEVLDLLPSAVRSFERLGMKAETAKTRYLEAMTLKELSRRTEAFEKLRALEADLEDRSDIGLLGQVLAEIGALHNADKRFDDALACYQRALKLVSQARRTFAVADLKLNIGEVLRNQGQLSAAVEAFREGVQTFEELGMTTWTAFARLALADTLLALGRPRQAEWEIQAALPVIEEQKMVPEGLAAVALLRESVRQRQANPRALREIREHLQAQS